jgi:hypothetical protein
VSDKNPYKAGCCHGSTGSFVTVEPSWSLVPPEDDSGGYVQITSCYFMSASHARELARQLIRAAVEADCQRTRALP